MRDLNLQFHDSMKDIYDRAKMNVDILLRGSYRSLQRRAVSRRPKI